MSGAVVGLSSFTDNWAEHVFATNVPAGSLLAHQAVATTACSALIDGCRCWRTSRRSPPSLRPRTESRPADAPASLAPAAPVDVAKGGQESPSYFDSGCHESAADCKEKFGGVSWSGVSKAGIRLSSESFYYAVG
jgi:hypothetical protein